jgi:hypothetical protein
MAHSPSYNPMELLQLPMCLHKMVAGYCKLLQVQGSGVLGLSFSRLHVFIYIYIYICITAYTYQSLTSIPLEVVTYPYMSLTPGPTPGKGLSHRITSSD